MAELADAGDLKSPGSNTVWVRPPPALLFLLLVGIFGEKSEYLENSAHGKECAVVFNHIETQGIITNTLVDDYLLTLMEVFIIDSKIRGLADGTLRFCYDY